MYSKTYLCTLILQRNHPSLTMTEQQPSNYSNHTTPLSKNTLPTKKPALPLYKHTSLKN